MRTKQYRYWAAWVVVVAALLIGGRATAAERVYSTVVLDGGTNNLDGPLTNTYDSSSYQLTVTGGSGASILLQQTGFASTNDQPITAYYALSPDGTFWTTGSSSMAVTNTSSGTSTTSAARTVDCSGMMYIRLLSIASLSTNTWTNLVVVLSVTR